MYIICTYYLSLYTQHHYATHNTHTHTRPPSNRRVPYGVRDTQRTVRTTPPPPSRAAAPRIPQQPHACERSNSLSPRRSHRHIRRDSATNISRAQNSVSRSLGDLTHSAHTRTHAPLIRYAPARRSRSRRKPRPYPPQAPRPSSLGPGRRVGAAAATVPRGRGLRSSAAHRPSPVTCSSKLGTLARGSGLRLEASTAKRDKRTSHRVL